MGARNTGKPAVPGKLAFRMPATELRRQVKKTVTAVTARNSGGNPSEPATEVVGSYGVRGGQSELAVVRYLVTHQAPRYHGPLWTATWGIPGVNLKGILVALVGSVTKSGQADGGAPGRLIAVDLVAVKDPVAPPEPLCPRAGASI